TRLEEEAVARFVKETGKEVNTDLVIFTRDDNENIAFSPDAYIGDTEVVEAKCLSSASHIEAWLTQEVPSEYEEQTIQPFIVNDTLT
ncbi:YqaJ viral recombinase family protein, partial [Escherichia coli]|uniref:YqaJ viral recombinase family protein n=1 Tax=Escherichia coli TaxID=562 RepID=UPI0021F29D1F